MKRSTMEKSVLDRSARILRQQGLGTFLVKGCRAILRMFRILYYPYARWKLPKETQKPYTPETAIDFVNDKYGGFIRPLQVRWEIVSLAKIVEKLRPKTVLEIGTSRGGTLFAWARLATEDAHIVSIDLPGGENKWAYPRWKEPFYKTFASQGQTIDLIRGDSHSEQAFAEFKRTLHGEKIDFLFIDGDHTYRGVKMDYELYSPFVRQGGVIALHDVAPHPPITNCEVHVFWSEVKQGKHSETFIEKEDQGWGGIGILFT
jgi:predicted O-methyltransferase YrrM